MLSSSLFPPNGINSLITNPPREIIEISVVSAPMSTIITPVGSFTSSPSPTASAIGFSHKRTLFGLFLLFKNNSLNPQKQDDNKSSYAKMLDKSLSKIDWNLSAREVHNKIRGLDPWPVALTVYEGKNLKLFRSRLLNEEYNKPAGTVFQSKDGIVVVCGDKNAVLITEVQLEGKKRMDAGSFLRGNQLEEGMAFKL